MSHAGPNTLKARIESMWAGRKTDTAIAAELGCSLEYVRYCIKLANSYATMGDMPASEDHAAHLARVFRGRKSGFPVLWIKYPRAA